MTQPETGASAAPVCVCDNWRVTQSRDLEIGPWRGTTTLVFEGLVKDRGRGRWEELEQGEVERMGHQARKKEERTCTRKRWPTSAPSMVWANPPSKGGNGRSTPVTRSYKLRVG